MKHLTVMFVVFLLLLSVTPSLANTTVTSIFSDGNSYPYSDPNGFSLTVK